MLRVAAWNALFVRLITMLNDLIKNGYDLKNEFECPEHWGFYEDPENCMKYYNCENGVAHSINCRTGKI